MFIFLLGSQGTANDMLRLTQKRRRQRTSAAQARRDPRGGTGGWQTLR